MPTAGGEAASPPANVVAGKRLRRPSVRLHQPYYENAGLRKAQQEWKFCTKKPRTAKNVNPKSKGGNKDDDDKGDETEEDFDFDDNVAIANWKSAGRGGDFKRNRARFSNSKNWGSDKSRKIEDLEIEKSPSASIGESEEDDEQREEEKGLDPYSPNCSVGNDEKLSDGKKGVQMWLNRLGLGKYGRLFEVHGVDEQVLPLLTLEDLKEMGINEVGIRRKMFCAIQKMI